MQLNMICTGKTTRLTRQPWPWCRRLLSSYVIKSSQRSAKHMTMMKDIHDLQLKSFWIKTFLHADKKKKYDCSSWWGFIQVFFAQWHGGSGWCSEHSGQIKANPCQLQPLLCFSSQCPSVCLPEVQMKLTPVSYVIKVRKLVLLLWVQHSGFPRGG